MISIVDYGVGNLGSTINMFKYIGIKCNVIGTPHEVLTAEKLVLPGVGSWDNGVQKLNESGLSHALNEAVMERNVPVLGICLGMQLLLESSEEGRLPGLGWINGKVKRFNFSKMALDSNKFRIPHMGWNIVRYNNNDYLMRGFSDEIRFYFVHSYHAVDIGRDNVFLTCNYGYDFTCGIHRENIWGVQFHPEKSHKFGMKLMKNFSEL